MHQNMASDFREIAPRVPHASRGQGAPIWWNSRLPDDGAAGAAGGKRSAEDEEVEARAAALRGDGGEKRARHSEPGGLD